MLMLVVVNMRVVVLLLPLWTVTVCVVLTILLSVLVKNIVLLTFLTRSNWTSPGGSGRTLLFLHPITSPWAAAQSASQATRSPASSPQQLIQHTQGIQHPGRTQTQTGGSWIKLIIPTQVLMSWHQHHSSWIHLIRPLKSSLKSPRVHEYILAKHIVYFGSISKCCIVGCLLTSSFTGLCWWVSHIQPGCTVGRKGELQAPWRTNWGPISDSVICSMFERKLVSIHAINKKIIDWGRGDQQDQLKCGCLLEKCRNSHADHPKKIRSSTPLRSIGRRCNVSFGLAADKAAPLENHRLESSGVKLWNGEHKMKCEWLWFGSPNIWALCLSADMTGAVLTFRPTNDRQKIGTSLNRLSILTPKLNTISVLELRDEAIL